MSQSSEAFAKGVEVVLEVIMFENWLRFYFISEKPLTDDGLFLAIPEQGMERIKELYPHLLPLAEDMNGKELTFESSRTAVCTFVVTEVDGKMIPKNMSDLVFDSVTFQKEMHLFNTWVQAHESQLDEGFLDFGAWRNFFSQWRETEAVQSWAEQMTSGGAVSDGEGADTVQ